MRYLVNHLREQPSLPFGLGPPIFDSAVVSVEAAHICSRV